MRSALLVLLALCACQKKTEPPPQASAPMAEVELNVDVSSDVEAARSIVFVSKEPCDSAQAGAAKYGFIQVKKGGPTFIEVFVPQGSANHVCAAAFDGAGQLIGLGGDPGNPVKMQGEGEVMLQPKVRIQKLAAPRPAPAGL